MPSLKPITPPAIDPVNMQQEQDNQDSKLSDLYDHWIRELEDEEKAHGEFRRKSRKIADRYKEKKTRAAEFNILWSNVEILQGALYSSTAKPDVRRRFLDKDPLAREISEVVERAISYNIDMYDFNGNIQYGINDYLVGGLGQVRVVYKPLTNQIPPQKILLSVMPREIGIDEMGMPIVEDSYHHAQGEVPVQEVQFDEMGTPHIMSEPQEELVYEEVACEMVPWEQFRWQPAQRWEDVNWTCIEHYLGKEDVEDQFGKEVAEAISFNQTTVKEKSIDRQKKAKIYEIFDKKKRQVITLCHGYPKALNVADDPLKLQEFYPFPKPLFATLTSDELIPIPDYVFYQNQHAELDRITARINKLLSHLKYRGVYDAACTDLANVANNTDGEFTPIDNFNAMFSNGKSIDDVLKIMPLDELQRVISALYQAREQIKQTIYEITGISDIVRGASQASETLGAQQLKGQFANMRISNRQQDVARFIRDLFRIKAEIICELFQPDILSQMTGIQITPEMIVIMRSDAMRSYKIDIESDSTVMQDASQEQKNRIDMLTAITGFMQQIGPAVQMGMVPQELAKEFLLFGIRSFKTGRQLEDALETLGQQPQQPQAMMPGPGGPPMPPGGPNVASGIPAAPPAM